MRFRPFLLALTSLFFIHSAQAQCVGENLIAKLPEAERSALYTAAHAAPFATGNLWRATKDDQIIHLAGTYHLDDPRHDTLMTRLIPLLAQSKTLLRLRNHVYPAGNRCGGYTVNHHSKKLREPVFVRGR